MIDFVPTDCLACDTANGHVSDCPHAEPDLPERPDRCSLCNWLLDTVRELESVERWGFAICDACEDERRHSEGDDE